MATAMTRLQNTLEELARYGIELTGAQLQAIEDTRVANLLNEAGKILATKCPDATPADVTRLRDCLLRVANTVYSTVPEKVSNQGRGRVERNMLSIPTEHGEFKVSLTRTISAGE